MTGTMVTATPDDESNCISLQTIRRGSGRKTEATDVHECYSEDCRFLVRDINCGGTVLQWSVSKKVAGSKLLISWSPLCGALPVPGKHLCNVNWCFQMDVRVWMFDCLFLLPLWWTGTLDQMSSLKNGWMDLNCLWICLKGNQGDLEINVY